jgi:tRNA pseudouridine38-40 synthase
MPRLKITLQYDGTDFHGWQIQPNAPSVQESIEQALTRLNSEQPIEVVGCGRTDAGVHAHHYVAHCDFETNDFDTLKFKLNGMLPKSIAILSVDQTHEDFHARFDATRRTYRYFINKAKNPFNERYAHYIRHQLDVKSMNEAAALLRGKQDFESFAKHHSDVNNFYCDVYEAFWVETEEQYIFQISANRFLRNMVRAIVGTLLDVGQGKMTPEELRTVISRKNRAFAGSSVPGKGLFLWEIDYD